MQLVAKEVVLAAIAVLQEFVVGLQALLAALCQVAAPEGLVVAEPFAAAE